MNLEQLRLALIRLLAADDVKFISVSEDQTAPNHLKTTTIKVITDPMNGPPARARATKRPTKKR